MSFKERGQFPDKTCKKSIILCTNPVCFSYGIGGWGNIINQTQQKKLQRTQNKYARLIDTRHNVAEIRRNFNILSINELTKLENYKLWYREQGNCLPKNLLKQMRVDHKRQPIRKKHGYDTCNKRQMNLPKASTTNIFPSSPSNPGSPRGVRR